MSESTRVLYVDDDADSAESAARALERADRAFVVDTATGPEEALDRLDSGFDCLAVTGSATDGLQLLVSVREQYPSLPVVLSPDSDADRLVDPAVAAGLPEDRTGDGYGLLAVRLRDAVDTAPDGETPQDSPLRFYPETPPDVAFYIDEEGRYADVVADRANQLLPDDPEALIGEHLTDVLSADTGERIRDTVQRTLQTGETQTVRCELEVQAGLRWFQARVVPAETADDGHEQVLLAMREITDQREREQVLEALHGMATSIQTADTVERACELTVTAAADILDFEMCNVTIREGDWLVPYAVSESAQPDGARAMGLEEGLAGKTFQTGESYIVDQVSSDDDTSPTFEAIEAGLSVPIGEHGVFQAVSAEPMAFDEADITLAELLVSHTRTAIDRIEREETLTRRTERLEEFASFVSHDLRNPLNVATLRLELLQEECDSRHAEGVSDALDRMERLIDELLTLARQGDTIGDIEPVLLADVVDRAWSNVETDDATLDCRTEQTLCADRNRLTAVMENLVRNAVEHGGQSVTVTVDALPDRAGFFLADDGDGISESEREQVFQSGYSTDANGTGFGLTIVRDIVEAHDWDIQITESENGGARFEVTGVGSAG